jgi:hypothetical protein
MESEVKLGRNVLPHVLFWSAMAAIMALGWFVQMPALPEAA